MKPQRESERETVEGEKVEQFKKEQTETIWSQRTKDSKDCFYVQNQFIYFT